MGNVLFYYTLTVLLIVVLAAATCLSAYFVSHRRTFLFALIGFLFYFFDVALVFQDDFISQNLVRSFYYIGNPYFSIVTGAGLLVSLWLLVCDYLGEKRRALMICPGVVYVLASLAVLWFVPEGNVHEFLFYSQRELMMYWMVAFVAFRYLTTHDETERARLRWHRDVFIVFLMLSVCAMLENVYFQLLFQPTESGYLFFIPERNFTENALLIACALFAFRAAWQMLSLRFEKPPIDASEPMHMAIDRGLAVYCKRHGLSEREGEVLCLVLLGKDNQNIASEMQLALNTVKVHVHNILHKTSQPNKRELIHDFWKG